MTVMAVPAVDLAASYRAQKDALDAAVARVAGSGSYILGREVQAFEEEFAAYLGAPFAIGVGSGTEALHLALVASGVGQGDAVFTVSHTAVATVAAVELAGGIPILVDIDPGSYTMSPRSLDEAIRALRSRGGATPRAVVPVHLYGHPADLVSIDEVARRHGLTVIEDCAQAHGARLDGRRVGTLGRAAAFSFYPTKNLGALGDGGMVVTGDPKVAHRARLVRQYGWEKRYVSSIPGWNTRLDEIQAGVLRVKLKRLDGANARRQDVADVYARRLAGTGLALPQGRSGAQPAWHQYVVRAGGRDPLREALIARGIGTQVHYPLAVHQQPAYRDRLPRVVSLAVTEAVVPEILSLPMFPEMTDEQVEAVCQAVREVLPAVSGH
jgi:dTDP-4-amino-4,6-dideoxygalactose transaminase